MLKVSHPVTLAGLLLVLRVIRSIILGEVLCTWLFYLLALVFLGGVIVVLLFIVSICANDKFTSGNFYRSVAMLLVAVCGRGLVNSRASLKRSFSNYLLRLRLYQRDCGILFVLFVIYLVLCLIRVVRIRKLEAGPLVKRL